MLSCQMPIECHRASALKWMILMVAVALGCSQSNAPEEGAQPLPFTGPSDAGVLPPPTSEQPPPADQPGGEPGAQPTPAPSNPPATPPAPGNDPAPGDNPDPAPPSASPDAGVSGSCTVNGIAVPCGYPTCFRDGTGYLCPHQAAAQLCVSGVPGHGCTEITGSGSSGMDGMDGMDGPDGQMGPSGPGGSNYLCCYNNQRYECSNGCGARSECIFSCDIFDSACRQACQGLPQPDTDPSCTLTANSCN